MCSDGERSSFNPSGAFAEKNSPGLGQRKRNSSANGVEWLKRVISTRAREVVRKRRMVIEQITHDYLQAKIVQIRIREHLPGVVAESKVSGEVVRHVIGVRASAG